MVLVKNPFNGQTVGLDPCVAEEIQELWKQGIRTTASCCGHKRSDLEKVIVVHKDSIEKFKQMHPKDYKKYKGVLRLNRGSV